MLDPPASVAYNRLGYDTLESAAHSELARTAAQKAICLYQNRAPARTGPRDASEKNAKLAQMLGQLSPYLSLHSHRDAWANLHILG
jgi:hypothetical protein